MSDNGYMWCPDYFGTKRHAVSMEEGGGTDRRGVCGAWAYYHRSSDPPPEEMPKCERCILTRPTLDKKGEG